MLEQAGSPRMKSVCGGSRKDRTVRHHTLGISRCDRQHRSPSRACVQSNTAQNARRSCAQYARCKRARARTPIRLLYDSRGATATDAVTPVPARAVVISTRRSFRDIEVGSTWIMCVESVPVATSILPTQKVTQPGSCGRSLTQMKPSA